MAAIEPVLEIADLRSLHFEIRLESPSTAWVCPARRRQVPPQPSTRR